MATNLFDLMFLIKVELCCRAGLMERKIQIIKMVQQGVIINQNGTHFLLVFYSSKGGKSVLLVSNLEGSFIETLSSILWSECG